MPDPSSVTLRSMITEVTNTIKGAGFTIAPNLHNLAANPRTVADSSFTLAVQNRDTGKYRNGDSYQGLRMEVMLTVSVLQTIRPNDQYESQLSAFDKQEKIMRAMSEVQALSYIRCDWQSTRPTFSPSREFMIVDMVFKIEMDWTWES